MRAYSVTPHENTAKPTCIRLGARDIPLARWTTRVFARSNQSPPRAQQSPLLHAGQRFREEVGAAATHAATSLALPWTFPEHHKTASLHKQLTAAPSGASGRYSLRQPSLLHSLLQESVIHMPGLQVHVLLFPC